MSQYFQKSDLKQRESGQKRFFKACKSQPYTVGILLNFDFGQLYTPTKYQMVNRNQSMVSIAHNSKMSVAHRIR